MELEKRDISQDFHTSAVFEYKQIFYLLKESIPNCAIVIGFFAQNFSSIYFISKAKDSQIMAVYGLGITLFNATGLVPIVGLNQGLQSSLSHAFGNKQYQLYGIIFQRQILIDLVYSLFVFIIFLNSQSILMMLGIQENLAEQTNSYLIYQFPQLIFIIFFDCQKTFSISQKEFSMPVKVSNISYTLNFLYCYIFCNLLKNQLLAVAMARNLSEFTAVYWIYKSIKSNNKFEKTFIAFNNLAFTNWIPYLKFILPISSIHIVQWIYFEFLTILIGNLNDEKQLAGQSAFLGLILLFTMASFGFSYTVNVYMGNIIGDNQIEIAKKFTKLSVYTTFLVQAIITVFGNIIKPVFISVLATDEEMALHFSNIYDIFTRLYWQIDFFNQLCSGLLKNLGYQNYSSVITIVVQIVVGVPLGYYMVLKTSMQVRGGWYAMAITNFLILLCSIYRLRNLDYNECFRRVNLNLQQQNKIQNIQDEKQEVDNNTNENKDILLKLLK